MKIIIFLICIFVSGKLLAEGPAFSTHKEETYINQEFDNVYQDLRSNLSAISVLSSTTSVLNAHPYIVKITTASITQTLTNNSSGYTDTGLTLTTTLSNASNKVLVFVSQHAYSQTDNCEVKLMRDSTSLGNFLGEYANGGASDVFGSQGFFPSFDFPNTVSAITYKTQFRSKVAGSVSGIGGDGTTAYLSYMIAVEVAGL